MLCSAIGAAMLSVVCLYVTFVHPAQTVKLFGNILSPYRNPIIGHSVKQLQTTDISCTITKISPSADNGRALMDVMPQRPAVQVVVFHFRPFV